MNLYVTVLCVLVLLQTNKDEDVRYKDRVHKQWQEKNNEMVW